MNENSIGVLRTAAVLQRAQLLCFPTVTPREVVWLGKTEVWLEPHPVRNDDVDHYMVYYFAP